MIQRQENILNIAMRSETTLRTNLEFRLDRADQQVLCRLLCQGVPQFHEFLRLHRIRPLHHSPVCQ
jgi:hypothetical protein